MEDKQIVDLYWERSESAIVETGHKYGRYCHYIAYQILYCDEDAEEVVNDTYWKCWSTIPPQRPQFLKAYVGMICRQLALNTHDAKHTQKRNGQFLTMLDELKECIPDNNSGTELGDNLALKDALNRFLLSLPTKTRNIFVRRYWYASSIQEIAHAYSMKESNIGMLLLRTRNKLKLFLQKEGFNI